MRIMKVNFGGRGMIFLKSFFQDALQLEPFQTELNQTLKNA